MPRPNGIFWRKKGEKELDTLQLMKIMHKKRTIHKRRTIHCNSRWACKQKNSSEEKKKFLLTITWSLDLLALVSFLYTLSFGIVNASMNWIWLDLGWIPIVTHHSLKKSATHPSTNHLWEIAMCSIRDHRWYIRPHEAKIWLKHLNHKPQTRHELINKHFSFGFSRLEQVGKGYKQRPPPFSICNRSLQRLTISFFVIANFCASFSLM